MSRFASVSVTGTSGRALAMISSITADAVGCGSWAATPLDSQPHAASAATRAAARHVGVVRGIASIATAAAIRRRARDRAARAPHLRPARLRQLQLQLEQLLVGDQHFEVAGEPGS